MDNINADLMPLAVKLTELHPDPRNARLHEERSIQAIATSLKEFGQQKAIVSLRDGTVIAGNGTLEAAKRLGWKKLAVVRFDDEKKARAYALADNRTAELSGWSNPQLAAMLDELQAQIPDWTPEMVGFSEVEVMKILASSQTEEVINNLPLLTSPDATAGKPPGGLITDPPANIHIEPSHVRMVQLFLDGTTQPQFMEQVKLLGAEYGTTTVTDTVLRAISELCSSLSTVKAKDARQSPAA